jgi:hypothetical protein
LNRSAANPTIAAFAFNFNCKGRVQADKVQRVAMKPNLRTLYLACAALVAWFGLILQSGVAFEAMWANGMSTPAALVKLFSYFTILTNSLVCLCYLVDVVQIARRKDPTRGWTWFRGGVAVSIATVGISYELLLRHLQYFEGWADLANTVVHDVTPALFVIYWLGCVPKGTLAWRSPFLWLLYPVLYLPWALAYGAMTGGYPYPFINAAHLGYPRVLMNSAGLFVTFTVLGLLLVAIDRFWPGKRPALAGVKISP